MTKFASTARLRVTTSEYGFCVVVVSPLHVVKWKPVFAVAVKVTGVPNGYSACDGALAAEPPLVAVTAHAKLSIANVAVMFLFEFISTFCGLVMPARSPLHPMKCQLPDGNACTCTVEPLTYAARSGLF